MLGMCAHGCRCCDVYCSIGYLSCESFHCYLSICLPITKMTRIQERLLQTHFVVMFLAYSHAAGAGSFKSIEKYGPYRTSALRRWFVSKCTTLAPKREVHDPRIPFFGQKKNQVPWGCFAHTRALQPTQHPESPDVRWCV